MAESGKLTDRAAEFAGQVVAAAGPLREKATEVAGQLSAATGPLAVQARERTMAFAGQAAAAAGPIAEQARVRAVQGVDILVVNLDRMTGGKYSSQIHSVASKVGGAIDVHPRPQAAPAPDLIKEPEPLRQQTVPLAQDDPDSGSQPG